MAKISLRAYIHEIDALIDRGQIDAAIDHCKYILKRYPKHIETYRSLGKAYLENRRYTEATDILTRLLAVVPDDYIAHIGMSIIREDEGNLDAAIFHMERAFEIQPSNQAIQEELKRLYGRRDGVEPSKIRLTRSALVRMYARGELYTQAVAEAKVALAEDPQRIDIELLLARMLFLAGQKTSAEQVCQRILEKLPYCFEANEILAKIYSQAKQSENAKRHQDIVNALEPYYAFISEKAPSPAQVPENAVTLEHLDWKPSQETGQQPEWAKTIGVNVQGGQDNIPDWMIAKPDTDTSSPETASPFYEESLGETPGFEEQITPFTEETNLPEWISSLQPEEATLPAAEPAETGETPEWLASLQTEEPALPAAEPAETGETPEWLASLQTEEPALPAAEPAETGETPDWLASLQTEEPALPASEPAETGETPDWLAALQPEEAAQPIEEPAEADLQEMPVPLQTELPDWMTQLDVIEKGEEVGKTSQAMEEEMPKWLQELENEVSEEEVLSREGTIEEQKEIEVDKELPDWVQNTETLRQPEETDTAREDKTLLSQITNLETPTSLPVTEALISPPETISAVPIESEPSPLSPFPQPTEEQAVAQGTQEPSIVKPQLEEITADLLNILEQARASMKQNDLPTALEHYSMLVETGQFLEDVIKDIQEALYRHPVDIDLWETYGDAHFKANHIQEALDAYTKAEELFR